MSPPNGNGTTGGGPYSGLPADDWQTRTRELVDDHPLDPQEIRGIALRVWNRLWRSRIGEGETSVSITEVELPTPVIASLFEALYAQELNRRYPEQWREQQAKAEKDIVHVPDQRYSFEIKCSGQLGTKVFGNRSYGQEQDDDQAHKSEKSGYYLTLNFHEQTLTLLRFGWIDHQDWIPQAAATGQAATLNDEIYEGKLLVLQGDYQQAAPIEILRGIGPARASTCHAQGVHTAGDALDHGGSQTDLKRAQESAYEFLHSSFYR